MERQVNEVKMMRFRESFRGYNKDDVNAYIEQVNLKFNRRESELRAQIAELQSVAQPVAAPTPAVVPAENGELEALKAELSAAKAENEELKTRLAKATANDSTENETAEKSKLYDSMSAQVGNILIVANSNAEKILNDAKTEAERIRTEASVEAEQIRRAAEEKLNGMTAVLEEKLKGVSEKCLNEYEVLMSEARVRFGQITDTMKERAKTLLVEADQKGRALEDQITEEYSASETDK